MRYMPYCLAALENQTNKICSEDVSTEQWKFLEQIPHPKYIYVWLIYAKS